ncbi:MAG: glycine zipper 2TM domain-containing protein [Telluria sp.]
METHQIPPARQASHHPLMILAAIAVVLFCLVGIAAVLGWLPSSVGGNPANRQLSEADRVALASGMQQQGGSSAAGDTGSGGGDLAIPAPAPAATPAQPLVQQYAPAQSYPAQPAPAAQPAPLAAPVPYEPPVRSAPATQLAANDRADHWCGNCGNIESIRTITSRARGSGLGAAGGAVLGGLLGNQVGSGNGRSLATVAGAVGGAVIGNQVEGNMHAVHSYEIRVRLDDGTLRTFHQSSAPAWHTGERVRIVKGRLRPA